MKDEYILCAALYYKDDKVYAHQPKNVETGIVICGRMHHNCWSIFSNMDFEDKQKSKVTQGFITSHDRFVDRATGGAIAYEAKQIPKYTNMLFSEELY